MLRPRLPARPRAVFLDAGNTLICLDFEEIARVLFGCGVTVPVEALRRGEYRGRVTVNRMVDENGGSTDRTRAALYFGAILEGAGIPETEHHSLLDAIRRRNDERGIWCVVPPGATEALAELKRHGITLGVISNADGRVRAQLESAKLLPHLDFIIDSHVVGIEKPDPRIFRMGLAEAKIAPEEGVYVGDLYAIDVAGAYGVGMAAVLVDPLWLEDVDCPRIRTVADLPRLLLASDHLATAL